ncbi:hypothetical protein ACVWZL_002375 [Bradyrhizobium sp. GM2.4]
MPVIVPAAEDVNRTPKLTCDVSESDSTEGLSEVENRLTVDGVVLTTILNISLAERLPRSAAVAFTLTVPTSADVGVPLKVRVDALKVSQAGSGEPSAAVAA